MNKIDRSHEAEEYQKHVDETAGDYKVSAGKFPKTLAKILCVLSAMLLWFYVTAAETEIVERNFSNLPIVFDGEDVLAHKDLGNVMDPETYKVDITVKGPRTKVEKLTADDIRAFVDVGAVTSIGEHSFNLQTDLPEGITSVTSRVITVNIDKTITQSVAVDCRVNYQMDADCKSPEHEWEYPRVIEVKGPATTVQRIKTARITISLGKLNQSQSLNVTDITYHDSDDVIIDSRYITVIGDVKVNIPVYMEKDIPLVIKAGYEYLSSEYVNADISPKTVTVKGDPINIKKLDKVLIKPAVENSFLDGNGVYEFIIESPDGGEIISGSGKATVTVTHRGTSVKTVQLMPDSFTPPKNVSNSDNYRYSSSTVGIRFRMPDGIVPADVIHDGMFRITVNYPDGATDIQSGYYPVTVEKTAELPENIYLLDSADGYYAYVAVQKHEDIADTK